MLLPLHPFPLVWFVWVLGFLFCLVFLVALPVSVSSWFFLVFVLGGGSLACWFGFWSCAHPAVGRSCGLCRWVGRRRVSCPRFGWKGRMQSRVSPRSRVSLRPASASPVPRPLPLEGGGNSQEQALLKGLQDLLQQFTGNTSDQGFGSPGKGKSPTNLDVPAKVKGKINGGYPKAKGKGKQAFPLNSGCNSGEGKGVGKTGTAAQNQGGTPEKLCLMRSNGLSAVPPKTKVTVFLNV